MRTRLNNESLKRHALLLLFILLASPAFSQSENEIVISEPREYYPVNTIAWMFRDPDGLRLFADISGSDSLFFPLEGEFYEFHNDNGVRAYWLKWKIRNESGVAQRYDILFRPGADTTEMFLINPDKSVVHLPILSSEPARTRPVHVSEELVFPAVLQPGETAVYFRISNSSLFSQQLNTIVVSIAREGPFLNHYLKARYYQGIALGMLAIMLVFHVFIYFFFRDKTYLYFVLNVFITFVYLLLRKNYQSEIGWLEPYLDITRYIHGPASTLLCITAILFTQSFLSTRREDIRVHQVMNAVIGLLSFVTLYMVTLQFLYWTNDLSIYLGFITVFVVIVASLRSYFRGNTFALYAFFGFLILLFVPLIYIFPLPGHDSFRNSESDFHYFAEAIRALIFAVGIANRFRVINQAVARKEIEKRTMEIEKEKQLRDEKERISRDLHDNIGTQLTSLTYGLNRLTKSQLFQPEKLQELYEHANLAILELRETIWVINKTEVTLEEFADKVNNLLWRLRQQDEARMYEMTSENVNASQRIQPNQAINLFRIVQEGVNNSVKHSQAKKITISLSCNWNEVDLRIADDGVGFDPAVKLAGDHYGLSNIRKRSGDVPAKLTLDSAPGQGTKIAIRFDCSSELTK